MLQIVLGGICIVLSLVILAYIGPGILTIILILSVILLVVGIERISVGKAMPSSYRLLRFANIGIGLLIIAFSIVLMQFPVFTSAVLVVLAAIALLVSGISRIIQGISKKALIKLGNYTGAITYLDKALKIDPNYKLALNNKTWALKQLHHS